MFILRVHKVLTIVLVSVLLTAVTGCSREEGVGGKESKVKKIDNLVDSAFALQYNDALACDSLADIVFAQSEKLNYTKGIANAWFLKSCTHQQLSNYDTAIELAQKALNIFIKIGDEKGQARIYNDLGIDYDFKANYAKAIENYLEALKIFERIGDTRGQSNAYNNIGLIYQNQNNFKEAVDYHKKAKQIAENNNYEDGVLNAMNSMGSAFKELGNYDSALFYLQKVLDADIKSGNKSYIAYSYNNVGEAYLKLGEYETAISYFEKSEKIKEELGNRRALANSLLNIGEAYIGLHEFESAESHLNDALAISNELQLVETQQAVFELLHRLEVQRQNYKQALSYYKQAKKVEAEIGNDKGMAKISRLEKDYEVDKAQHLAEKSETEAKVSRLLSLVYGGVAIVLLILLGAVWVGYRQKKQSNKILLEYQEKLHQQNAELEEINKKVVAQKKETEQALAARSRFLSFMSHEIRTPLNGITGLVDLLLAMPMMPDQKEYMEALKQSADNLLLLLNNILDLSRLEAGKVELERGRVNFHKIIKDQAILFKASAQLKDVKLSYKVDENVPESLQGDGYRINQILSNLINNAIKFTREGEVRLECSLVKNVEEKVTVKIAVVDNGIGISKENIKTIIEPFSQAETHTTRKYGGTGLGLSIVQLLLDAMGTQLEIESEPNKGSTFSFILTLPTYEAPFFVEERAFTQADVEEVAGKKILVVEDNTTNILVLTKVLSSWRVEYNVADNGFKALEYAEEKKYDIILMDLHLPKITGYETAQRIKTSNGINSKTPILAITAADDSEIQNHPQKHFLDDVMYKPVQTRVLLYNIKKLTA